MSADWRGVGSMLMGPHYRIVSSQLDEGWLSTPACRLCTNYHMCVKMKVMVHVIGFHSHMIESVEPLNNNGSILGPATLSFVGRLSALWGKVCNWCIEICPLFRVSFISEVPQCN